MAAPPNNPTPRPATDAPAPSRVSGIVAIATAKVPIVAAAAANMTRELLMTELVAFQLINGALRGWFRYPGAT
jgi:hypothetical protein